MYAGTFFRCFKGANVYACTNIRGSRPWLSFFILIYQVNAGIYIRGQKMTRK